MTSIDSFKFTCSPRPHEMFSNSKLLIFVVIWATSQIGKTLIFFRFFFFAIPINRSNHSSPLIDAGRLPEVRCSDNFVLSSCYEPCTENTCANLRSNFTMPCETPCLVDVCVCPDHLFKNECKKCVSKEQCDEQCV